MDTQQNTTETNTTETVESTEPNKALTRFINITFEHTIRYEDYWCGITFEASGARRLVSIAGWLTGLCQSGQQELANQLATDIDEKLTYLSLYGGFSEYNPLDVSKKLTLATEPITIKRFRVVLYDDGTMNGFGILWNMYVPESKLDSYDNYDEAYKELRIQPDLHQDKWMLNDSCESVPVTLRYGYSMNGGLLYHGPGGTEVFAVTLETCRAWSIHT